MMFTKNKKRIRFHVTWVCLACGARFGVFDLKGDAKTFDGDCDLCATHGEVTHISNYGYLDKHKGQYVK